ncbi:kinase-like protein [Exidia glandulosa HHB12029]|uniref:Kinase-like protein n=1 Tax=Exidia glandulosa HHB12029 TaxID=1314781 RepID=A0A166MQG7_EXIGL|nr:kinase-like protein [Exidia glandulosa HHB12029]
MPLQQLSDIWTRVRSRSDPGSLLLPSAAGDPHSPPDILRSSNDITHEVREVSAHPVKYGGSSDIYSATWQRGRHNQKVALKIHRVLDASDQKAIKRLRREISVWKRLEHPNVNAMCGLFLGLGVVPAMVSLWCEEGDISRYLKVRSGDPNIGEIKTTLMIQVANGLKYLHQHDIIHGDIKGANVLVGDDGTAKLCDFGFSILLAQHSQSFTQGSNVKGTCRWMAPELFDEEGAAHTFASDIWATGCLLIEIQCAVLPYHTKISDQQVILALSQSELPPRPKDMPDALWRLVMQCCSAQPPARASLETILFHLQESHAYVRLTRMMTASGGLEPTPNSVLARIKEGLVHSAKEDPTLYSRLFTLPDSASYGDASRLRRYRKRSLRARGQWIHAGLHERVTSAGGGSTPRKS